MSFRSTVLLGAGLFFAVLAGSVTIQAQRIDGQHEIDRLEAGTIAAVERNRELRALVAVAESPARIMDEAAALEMVEPGAVVPLVSSRPESAATAPAGAEDVTPEAPTDPVDQPVDQGGDGAVTMGASTNDRGQESTR